MYIVVWNLCLGRSLELHGFTPVWAYLSPYLWSGYAPCAKLPSHVQTVKRTAVVQLGYTYGVVHTTGEWGNESFYTARLFVPQHFRVVCQVTVRIYLFAFYLPHEPFPDYT